MIICIVGDAGSSHIVKLCNFFSKRGHEIHVVSFTEGTIATATIHMINVGINPNERGYKKIRYIFMGGRINRIIEKIHPDVISVHFASSYGTAMAFAKIRNYSLSVWGSDIYDFPHKSILHKLLLKYSLKKAAQLLSTSCSMAEEARKYTDRSFEITPFGVDMNLFNPAKRTRSDGDFVIGTVKGLADVYGIEDILNAVAIVRSQSEIPIRLRIAGNGPKEQEYHALARKLGIDDITTWLGNISQENAASEWANMDIAVIPSYRESFGVAAVEAQACSVPVVISNAPGLLEVTIPDNSCLVVPMKSPDDIANAITKLYNNPELRRTMGSEGRKNVVQKYDLNTCFERIEKILTNGV